MCPIILSSCTGARWTVKEKESVDQSDYKIVDEQLLLRQSGEVSPQNPVLSLDLLSRISYRYNQRVLMQRNIQDYKLRPGLVALGIGGAAMAFYLANSTEFSDSRSTTEKWTLNSLGGVMLASGFLNMKPVSEPRPTGEERYMRSTGDTVAVDTVKAGMQPDTSASVYMLYNDLIVYEEHNRSITDGKLDIPVGNILNDLQLSGREPGRATVEILFADSLYRYSYPIQSVLQPYASVTTQITALRNSPEEDDNVLADLVKGSRLQIDSFENDNWYQVLYGISKTYIKKDDAKILWRSEGFGSEDQIVAVPRVPFGNIDVESNIPFLRQSNPNAKALLIVNQNYTDTLESRNYSLRDARLMRTYLENALGYREEHTYQLADITSADSLNAVLTELHRTANDSTELFVYISGQGSINVSGDTPQLQYLSVGSDSLKPSALNLADIFEKIGKINTSQTIVLSDIDFSSDTQNETFEDNRVQEIVESNTKPLISNNPQSALLMGTKLNYPSSLYISDRGEDKKHHVFPYFFAKALQQRRTVLSDIYLYLERNISYTTRRLFDRPQDPLLIGNTQLDLAAE